MDAASLERQPREGIRTWPPVAGELPRASAADAAAVVADVLMPLVARGVIVRRPRVASALDRLDADRRAVRRLQRLRDRYGNGPVVLGLGGRELAVIIAPEDVHRVLLESPEPFALATREKRAALEHFQPHGVLISHGHEREERRGVNEDALDSARQMHRLADRIAATVDEEASGVVAEMRSAGTLTWDDFARTWWRIVRRVVLGDSAADDHETTDLLRRLRADANWASLKPKRAGRRERFLGALAAYVERAEPGSLAALLSYAPPSAYPVEQMPQWLFAFDAAGMAAFRALALLTTHAERLEEARDEIGANDLTAPHELSFLRACVLDSVRLWPTTPAILRETTTATSWANGTLAAGATVLVFAPFFHRDDTRFELADTFAPELWLEPRTPEEWPLVPFSEGPGECAGRNLVLFTTSTLLAQLLVGRDFRLVPPPELRPDKPLPRTVSPFRLRFEVLLRS